MNKGLSKKFDLQERMARLAVSIIALCKKVGKNEITRPLISQLVRSGGSISANYCEASNASSRKDFRNKLLIAKKEAQETKHWLQLPQAADEAITSEARVIWQETHEITLILHKSLQTLEKKLRLQNFKS